MRISRYFLAAAALSVAARAGTLDSVKPGEVLIHRDKWGVPHIYGGSATAVAFGFGYAQAEDHLDAMLKLFLRARGEISRLEGESAVSQDLTERTLLVPEIIDQTWPRVPQSSKDYYQAFADGINRYLATHPGEKQPWHWQVSARDVAIYTKQVVLRNGFWTAGDKMIGRQPDSGIGSNAWAIAGSRSASGKAMLLGNPHLPWTGALQWYEAHLKCPEFDMSGVGFFGTPMPALGHNADIAWSATDNRADIVNVYREKIDPQDADRYLDSDGQWKRMEKRAFAIEVAQSGGSLKTETRTARYTRRGPYLPGARGESFSVAVAGWKDMPDPLTGSIRRAAAHNLGEFKAALAEYPMDKWHLVYADRAGSIYIVGNGYFPRRDPKYNWDQPVPGWEEAAQWKGIIPFSELPQYANPPGGLIVQCNQSVFASAEPSPIKAADYPPFIAHGAMVNQRESRTRRAFELLAGPKVTWEDHKRTALDPYGPQADQFVRVLLGALDETAAADPDLAEIRSILKGWDQMATLDNRAVPILSHWIRLTMEKHMNLRQLGANTPEARASVLALLQQTAAEMQRLYGKISVPLRDVQVLARGSKEVPVGGTGGGLGTFNPFAGLYSTSTRQYRNGKFYATAGSSWMMLIEFQTPLRVFTLVPFGNSENPSSPHYADQAELYSRAELKPSPFADDEVKAMSEKSYRIALR